jgi:hypothetical protein
MSIKYAIGSKMVILSVIALDLENEIQPLFFNFSIYSRYSVELENCISTRNPEEGY